MKILVAADSFKDALSAEEVCAAIARGIHRVDPDAEARLFPLADGGEGTAAILTHHAGGELVEVEVSDPLRRPVKASFGWVEKKKLAFIDMAEASGLPRLTEGERDPLKTSTYGTGELIEEALRRGGRHIVLGIGGSATNDGGTGMAAALGYRFLDTSETALQPRGGNLESIERIDISQSRFDPKKVEVTVISDVDNPLYGPRGASRIYGPQKGATAKAVEKLERGLRHLDRKLQETFGRSFAEIHGAGAAGGLGAGAAAFLGATLRPGIETVMEYTRFASTLEGTDLVITGEGRLDGQTLHGKLIHGIARRAGAHNLPVIALCGSLEADTQSLRSLGLSAAFSILPGPMTLAEAMSRTPELLSRSAAEVFSLWKRARSG